MGNKRNKLLSRKKKKTEIMFARGHYASRKRQNSAALKKTSPLIVVHKIVQSFKYTKKKCALLVTKKRGKGLGGKSWKKLE